MLAGKRVVLTGASGGIGGAMAEALDAAGADLLLVGRDPRRLSALAARLDGRHRVVTADLASATGRDNLAASAAAHGVDILINNAGISDFGGFDAQTPETLSRQVEVNLLAPMLVTRQLLPLLRESAAGVIVNVGSAFGAIGYPGFVAYSAAKFGLRGFSEALRRELADTPVRVLYLAPRATATALNDATVDALNHELGNAVDPPQRVAAELLRQLRRGTARRSIGAAERFFGRLNALLPSLVDGALRRRLPLIRRHIAATRNNSSPTPRCRGTES